MFQKTFVVLESMHAQGLEEDLKAHHTANGNLTVHGYSTRIASGPEGMPVCVYSALISYDR